MTQIRDYPMYICTFQSMESEKRHACSVTKVLPRRLALDFHTAKSLAQPQHQRTSQSRSKDFAERLNLLLSPKPLTTSHKHIYNYQILYNSRSREFWFLVFYNKRTFRRRRISERSCAHKPQNYTPPSSISILGPKHSLRSSFSRKTNRKYGFR